MLAPVACLAKAANKGPFYKRALFAGTLSDEHFSCYVTFCLSSSTVLDQWSTGFFRRKKDSTSDLTQSRMVWPADSLHSSLIPHLWSPTVWRSYHHLELQSNVIAMAHVFPPPPTWDPWEGDDAASTASRTTSLFHSLHNHFVTEIAPEYSRELKIVHLLVTQRSFPPAARDNYIWGNNRPG